MSTAVSLRLFLSLIVAMLCSASLQHAHAQFRTQGGTQSEDCSVPLPKLPHIPELHADMPTDCLEGYALLDSTGMPPPFNKSIEDLQTLSRFVYNMADYDPLLLLRHFTSLTDSSDDDQYRPYSIGYYFGLLLEIDKRMEAFGKLHALLIMSSYVLHVRVTDVRSGIDSALNHSKNWTNVACEVVESFKGKTLPNNCRYTTTTRDKGEHTLATPSCLVYGHGTRGYIPKAGDEFIIFLYIQPLTETYAILYPFGLESSAGRFRIESGKVGDPNNFFGLGTNPSLTDCKTELLNAIQDIRSWK